MHPASPPPAAAVDWSGAIGGAVAAFVVVMLTLFVGLFSAIFVCGGASRASEKLAADSALDVTRRWGPIIVSAVALIAGMVALIALASNDPTSATGALIWVTVVSLAHVVGTSALAVLSERATISTTSEQ